MGLLALVAVGCDFPRQPGLDYDSLGLTEVTGVVTMDGEPLSGATVSMLPAGSFSGSYGKTDASGNYRMMYTSEKSGVMPGEKVVRVSTADLGPESPRGAERVPAKYNSKSTLTVTIPEGSSLVWNIELDSKGKIDAQEVEQDENR